MTLCGLCRKDLREEFVAKSGCGCGYFCLLDELPSYERVVQLDVTRAFSVGDAPFCQHQKPCA